MIRALRIALVVIAIAILDGAFVHPSPGTEASDHLASGVVPASIALVLAALLPRLPPLVRGLVLLAAGALAVTAGVSAGFAPIAVSGPARSSLTAAAAGVAGCVLIVAGVGELWVSRRRDGSRARRWARRTAIAAGAAVAGFLVVLPIALAIVATHGPRRPVHRAEVGRPYEQRDPHHVRRSATARLVRPVAQPGGGGRRPRPRRHRPGSPDARASWLRRAALRCPRSR